MLQSLSKLSAVTGDRPYVPASSMSAKVSERHVLQMDMS